MAKLKAANAFAHGVLPPPDPQEAEQPEDVLQPEDVVRGRLHMMEQQLDAQYFVGFADGFDSAVSREAADTSATQTHAWMVVIVAFVLDAFLSYTRWSTT